MRYVKRKNSTDAFMPLTWVSLGKTFVASEKLKTINFEYAIVVCQKSKVTDWYEHFKMYYPQFNVIDYTKKGAKLEPGIIVINYDLLWRRKEFLQLKHVTLILDESSLIQIKTAKRTKFILKIDADNVILLSGTVCGGKYENLWTQAQLLGWNISENLYNRQYVNWKTVESDGFFHKIVDMDNPYKNVERLKQKFRDYGAVFMKTEDVFDLPEQTFIPVTVPTSKEYRKFMKDSYVQLADGSELIGDQVFTKRLYARQLCGMYSKDKLDAFRELIQSTKDRVIVFYNFNGELDQIKAVCDSENRPYSVINGSVKDLSNYEQKDDSVTICQYQAASMGLNLQKANKMIYFTLPERSDLFEQSKKRVHRIGQNRPCFYWILMCTNSVEEIIYETLQERKDFTDELFIEKNKVGKDE